MPQEEPEHAVHVQGASWEKQHSSARKNHTLRDWEQGAHRPDKAALVLLTVIANDPDAVVRALES